MMRQLFIFPLITVIAISLISCGDSGTGPDPGNEENGGEETSTYTVDASVSPSDAGSISPSANDTYDEGETAELTAEASDEYLFTEWTGDVESEDNPLSLTVDQDYSLTANFEKKSYALTTNTEGNGAIDERVVEEKSTDYEHGTVVELTANAADGYEFVEWKGDLEGSDNPSQITVDDPKEVTAVFEKNDYELAVETSGQGSVTKSPDQPTYAYDTEVELSADPGEGYKFVEWQGDTSGTDNPAQITMNKEKKVTAVFEKKSFALTTNTSGSGSITKSPDQSTYEYETTVELEAVPDGGHGFVEWTGAIASTDNPVQLTVDEEKEVTAVFEEEQSKFYLAENRVTIKCEDAEVGDTGTVDGVTYTKRSVDQITTDNAETTCTSGITDMSDMFDSANNFNGDISHWDVSSVTDMSSMFDRAYDFNQDLSTWDVSGVTDMSRMFSDALSFDQDISAWSVSSVTDMNRMFQNADAFNQDLISWDVSSVKNMSNMFFRTSAFDGDISDWDVSSVTDMGLMFSEASSFNGDISGWDVSSVTSMFNMFSGASSFNGDIGDWDVSGVEDMDSMFQDAKKFDQDINFDENTGSWDVSGVTDMESMFEGASSFNQDISSWDVSSVINMKYMFKDASDFNQNISTWCLSQITTTPIQFSFNAGFAGNDSYMPEWDCSE